MRQTSLTLFLIGILVSAFIAILLISQLILQDFPNSGDEWAYLSQARIFSTGRLSVDSPPNRAFFEVAWMINNGKFYAKYPPGWPLILTPGILLGAPWLINPLLGIVTLVVLYRLGLLIFNSQPVALAAVGLTASSPFFLFQSASYWAHTSSLLFISLFVLFSLKGMREKWLWDFVLAGLCGAVSFLIRPFDQMIISALLGSWLLLLLWRKEISFAHIIGFSLTHAVGPLLLMGYNFLQNGHPFVMGYQLALYTDETLLAPFLPGWKYLGGYLLELFLWTFPTSLIALFGLLWFKKKRIPSVHWKSSETFLLLTCLFFIFFYLFVPYHYLEGYGPRYYYSAFFALALLGGRGAIALLPPSPLVGEGRDGGGGDKRPLLPKMATAICLGTYFLLLPYHGLSQYKKVDDRLFFQRMVQEADLHNAVIFVKAFSGDLDPWNLVRNSINFDGDIVYVWDYGEELNEKIMEQYRGRQYFVYDYGEVLGEPRLRRVFSRNGQYSWAPELIQNQDKSSRREKTLWQEWIRRIWKRSSDSQRHSQLSPGLRVQRV
ncbi:MAG: glycosyltransferase family 39 protein [Candidatus Tectomicrobia bacterium]|nr:glycosyltransferase family 39 protein [Candidatus Tectomicrobia bacterium]